MSRKLAELGHRARERVADERGVALAPACAPRAGRPSFVSSRTASSSAARRSASQLAWRGSRRCAGRSVTSAHTGPSHREFGAVPGAELRVLRARGREERVEDEVPHPLPEGPDDAVAHRVDRGVAAPGLHEPSGLRALGTLRQGVRGQDREEELLPAREEERAVVELDAQHVALARLLDGEEVVPDLPLARAEVVAAHAHLRELLSARRRARWPSRCGRSAGPRRGGSPRGEPAVPPAGPVRPRRGHAPVVAHAARDAADDRPADAPRRVGHHEVLVRHPGLGGERLRLVEAPDRLHAHERGVEAALAQRHPRERPAAAGVVLVDHRAPRSWTRRRASPPSPPSPRSSRSRARASAGPRA